ncbi:WD40-repeat-containing domain protein [Biscogniauxia marginata]|nr:WD40-repeat-containing domain protein [Biscogniauxia marginata]
MSGDIWGTVCLWEVQTEDLINSVRDSDTNSVPVLLFNPNPSIDLLLVVYKQRGLALYETFNGSLMKRQAISGVASIISVTCSPDGRTLVSANTHGTLQIWDFESLNLLYQVATPATSFRTLQFASDGSKIIDMVDSGMRIWTPAILVRRNVEEDQSDSDDAPDLATIDGDYEITRTVRITAACAHPSLPVVFIGKHHGQIVAFDSRTGTEIELLYSHAHAALVKHIAVSKNNVIASSDVNGIVQMWNLAAASGLKIKRGSLIQEMYSTAPIRQLCFSARGDYLLVATAQSDTVYSIKDRSLVGMWDFQASERRIWRWLQVTNVGIRDDERFALLDGRKLKRFSAPNFPSLSSANEVEIDYTIKGGIPAVDINAAFMCIETQALVIDVHYMSGFVALSTMFLFGLGSNGSSTAATLTPLRDELTKHCKHFIGFVERSKNFVFLDHDSWLCSVDLPSLTKGLYSRHFFVPSEYISTTHKVMPVQTADDSYVFCLHGGIVIVKNGLNFRETKEL